jgi:hypothetical protein
MAKNKFKPDDVATGVATNAPEFKPPVESPFVAEAMSAKPITNLPSVSGDVAVGAVAPKPVVTPAPAKMGIGSFPEWQSSMPQSLAETAIPSAISSAIAPPVGPRIPAPSGPTLGVSGIPAPKTLDESLKAPAPAPAVGGEGYVEVGGKREPIPGTTQFGMRGVTTGNSPAVPPPSIAPAVSAGGEMIPRAPATPQTPDIAIPAFDEPPPVWDPNLSSAQVDRAGYNAAHTESLKAYNERKAAHQKATYALSLAKAGFSNDQIVQIIKGGTERDVAKTKANADVAVGKFGVESATAKTAAGTRKADIYAGIKQTNDNLDSYSKELDAVMKDPMADKEVIRSIRGSMEIERQKGEALRKQLTLPDGAVGDGAAMPSAAATTRPRNIGEAMARAKSMGATQFKFDGQTYPVQ